MIVAGDKTTCGATFISSQNLVVKASGSVSGLNRSNSLTPTSQNSNNLTNSFSAEKEQYINYYIPQNSTDVFISHKAVIQPFDEGVQVLSGAVSYLLNYALNEKSLFKPIIYLHRDTFRPGKEHPRETKLPTSCQVFTGTLKNNDFLYRSFPELD